MLWCVKEGRGVLKMGHLQQPPTKLIRGDVDGEGIGSPTIKKNNSKERLGVHFCCSNKVP